MSKQRFLDLERERRVAHAAGCASIEIALTFSATASTVLCVFSAISWRKEDIEDIVHKRETWREGCVTRKSLDDKNYTRTTITSKIRLFNDDAPPLARMPFTAAWFYPAFEKSVSGGNWTTYQCKGGRRFCRGGLLPSSPGY